jgi:hypothetical protein
MSAHVTDDRVVDLAQGPGTAEEAAHLAACAGCASRVGEAREALALAQAIDVPEPHPLYWEALRRNVGRRIDQEGRRARWWAWLAPLAAAAAVAAIAVRPGVLPSPAASPAATLPAWTALPEAEDDPSLAVLEAVLADSPGVLDEALPARALVAALTEEESRDVVLSLRGIGGES